MNQIYDVLIIGTGFSGLGAALQSPTDSILMLESGNRAGGRAQTIHTKRGDPINMGPNWDHGRKESSLYSFIKEAGLKWRMDNSHEHAHFLYKGKIYGPEFKKRFFEVLEKNFLEAQREDPGTDGPFEKYLGGDKQLLDYAPYIRKTFSAGGKPNQVSTKEFLGNPYGSGGIVLKNGIAGLIDELVTQVTDTIGRKNIKYGTRVKSIDDSGDFVTVHTQNGKTYRAKRVICTTSVAVLQNGNIEFTQGLSRATRKTLSQLSMGQMAKVLFQLKELPKEMKNGCRVDMIDKKFPTLVHIGIARKRMLSAIFGGEDATAIEKDWRRATGIVRKKLARLNRIPELKGIDKLLIGRPVVTTWGQQPDVGGAYSCWKVGSTPCGPIQDGRIYFTGEAFDINSGHMSGAFSAGAKAMKMAIKSMRRAHRPHVHERPHASRDLHI